MTEVSLGGRASFSMGPSSLELLTTGGGGGGGGDVGRMAVWRGRGRGGGGGGGSGGGGGDKVLDLAMFDDKGGGEKGRNKSIWSGEVWEGSRVGGDKSRLVHLCCNSAIYFT